MTYEHHWKILRNIPTTNTEIPITNITIKPRSRQHRPANSITKTTLRNQGNKTWNKEKVTIRLNYTLLLERISKEQALGLHWNEIPLIIHTDLATYTMAYITYEDEEYLSIVVPNKDGAEYAKILNKNTILSVDVIYAQMLEKPTPFKEDMMYG